jgi:hypothetical protein
MKPEHAEKSATERVDLSSLHALLDVQFKPIAYEVDNTGCRQFAQAVGYTDAVYYDESAALERGCPAIRAAPGFFGLPVSHEADRRAFETIRAVIPYRRTLHGSTEMTQYADVFAGDRLLATDRIVEVSEKSGSLGHMVFVVTERTFVRENGEALALTRQTVIWY